MTWELLIGAALVVPLAWFSFRTGPRIFCNGKCRRHAPHPDCPLHGRGGKA